MTYSGKTLRLSGNRLFRYAGNVWLRTQSHDRVKGGKHIASVVRKNVMRDVHPAHVLN